MQIILEIKVKKNVAIEDEVQMCDNASATRGRITDHRLEEQKSLLLVFARAE